MIMESTPNHQGRMDALVHRQRHVREQVEQALATLGSPKTSTNKSSSEDEGLGQDLHDLLNSEGSPAVNRGSASPLPSLRGEDANYDSDNAVDYNGTDEDTDLPSVFEQDNQPLGIQSQDAQQSNQPLGIQSQDAQQSNQPLGIQSQDAQQNSQPSGIRETRTQAVQPVLTQQGVIDLVSKDTFSL